MLKKIFLLVFVTVIPVVIAQNKNQATNYQNNSCVTCHAKITEPIKLSNRYFEWHASSHKDYGVACDKCHGGDPASTDKGKAHAGIRAATETESRINYRNLPTTCASCHKGVTNFFVESKHYQKLQGSGLGPSCSTCHAHMASEVMMSPQQIATLCANCHNTIGGALRPRPEIGEKAEVVLDALNRADVAVGWASSLLRSAETKRIYIPTERIKVVAAQGTLKEAKFSWHAFDLETTQKKADEAFRVAMQAKEELEKKLPH